MGISVVRNEADIIGVTVAHHLSQGLDEAIVLDNGSTDGTDGVLESLAERDPRVSWRRNDSPFDQSALVTGLAREAHRRGADWVLPFDADEFWVAEGGLRGILAGARAGVLAAGVVNFVQARRRTGSSPEGLLNATMRVPEPLEPGQRTRELIEAHRASCVEMAFPRKCVFRPAPGVRVRRGNHRVEGAAGPPEESDSILCLHVPLRSRVVLEARVDRKARLDDAGISSDRGGWRVGYWNRMAEKGMMGQEWAANSHEGGNLDVYGQKHGLVPDLRLRDAAAPHLPDARPGPSAVRRLLTATAGKALGAWGFAKSVALARGDLARTRRELEETTRRLAQAERRNERMTQRLRRVRGELKDTARDYLLCKVPAGAVCAEIGVYEGDFSRQILAQVRPGRLHLIDPWKQGEGLFGEQAASEQDVVEERYEKVRERFAQEIGSGQVHLHRALSSEVANEFGDSYFDLVYVDGNHLREYVRQDLDLYYPKVKPGGHVAGDDYGVRGYWENGVQEAVDEFVAEHPEATLEVKSSQFVIRKAR